MKKIVLATGNKGKVKELDDLLANAGFDVIAQSAFNVSDVEETGLTFVENAIIKARHASKITNLPAIADDSGLSVDALQGEPGIYSARYAGEHGNDKANNQKLLSMLSNISPKKRTAQFNCALVYLRHAEDPTPIICQGIWRGIILEKEIGQGGFGYDPLFFIPEENCTAAELSSARKSQISHRGQALKQLLLALKYE